MFTNLANKQTDSKSNSKHGERFNPTLLNIFNPSRCYASISHPLGDEHALRSIWRLIFGLEDLEGRILIIYLFNFLHIVLMKFSSLHKDKNKRIRKKKKTFKNEFTITFAPLFKFDASICLQSTIRPLLTLESYIFHTTFLNLILIQVPSLSKCNLGETWRKNIFCLLHSEIFFRGTTLYTRR